MSTTLGFFGALLIGIVLGILGSGGTILTVPVLVYILNYNPLLAMVYSLFIVGTTSGIGTIQNFKRGLIVPKTAIQFAIPSLIGVYITRKFIVSRIPETILYLGSLQLSKATFLMLIFAIVLFLAGYSILKNRKEIETIAVKPKISLVTVFQLLFIGILMGLIGAGGGFLLIPALLKFTQLPIKKAIATSLLVITINSLIGFLGDVQNTDIDWTFLLTFTTISVIGIFIGQRIQQFINENYLKKIFGIFVLTISLIIFYKEIFS